MRVRAWAAVLLVAVSVSGCGIQESTERKEAADRELERYLATQPWFNGSNAALIIFWVCFAAVLLIGSVAAAVAHVRAARHAARARVNVARIERGLPES